MSDDTTLLAPPAAEPVPKPARPRWPLFVLGVLVGGIGVVLAGVFLYSGVLTGLLPPVFRPPGGTPAPTATATATKAPRYHCPMHPTYTSDRPGDCPICGMKLVPIEDTAADSTPTAADDTPDATGFAGVTIDAERQQLIGLRTAEVTLGPVGRTWRTSGRVVVDETRVRKVNVKVEGFVEKLHVDFIGRPVKRGEALLEMYSPEVMAAQYELLLAARTEKALDNVALGNAPGGNPGLLEPARQKLRLWDVPNGAIARVERTGQVARTVTLSSPIAGVVTAKTVVQGSRMLPGDTPFEITDLSHVWVLADVYATEIALVQQGQPATLWLQGRPGRPFQGAVEFLDPLVDEKTRTVRVRLQFDNASGELRPGSFGEVEFRAGDRNGLLVPTDAVIDSGTQKVVFLALPGGRFAPKVVQTAPAPGDRFEVTSGLQQGDQVVTRATFLVDSESRLKAALAAMAGSDWPVRIAP